MKIQQLTRILNMDPKKENPTVDQDNVYMKENPTMYLDIE